MWTPATRQKHSRTVTRYQTDLTDTEWRVIAPHLPKPCAAGKKVNGRKRHALVDTDGRGLVMGPHPASVQDRDGGGPLLSLSPVIPLYRARLRRCRLRWRALRRRHLGRPRDRA